MLRAWRGLLFAVLLVGMFLIPSKAEAKGLLLITYGDSIKHMADVPAEAKEAITKDLGPDVAIGYKYSYAGLFWLDIWTWGGEYCLFKDKTFWSLKPEQAAQLMGVNVDRYSMIGFALGALLAVARRLAGEGIGLVAVSMGAEGALFVTRDEAWKVRPPALAVTSSVGAGDAMVAGLATGLADGLPVEALARRAAAFSAGKLQRTGAQLPARAEVEAIAAGLATERLA